MSEITTNIEKAITNAEELNGELNSFLSIEKESALKRAQEISASPSENKILFGKAIAIKDNICVTGMQTSCGSKILGNFHPQYSAPAVASIRVRPAAKRPG